MIETLATQNYTLRAVFSQVGERFTHSLCVAHGEQSTSLLTTTDSPPVFQELHQQGDSPAGSIAFLTGMANHRYWSASVSANPANSAELMLDLACRTKQPPTSFATHYVLAPEVEAIVQDGNIHLHPPSAPACVLAPTINGTVPTCELSLDNGLVEVTPVEFRESIQWGLRLSLGDC